MAGFYFAVIFLVLTFLVKNQDAEWLYFILLLAAGFGIGGPNSLIGSAVSADIVRILKNVSEVITLFLLGA